VRDGKTDRYKVDVPARTPAAKTGQVEHAEEDSLLPRHEKSNILGPTRVRTATWV
jgi:hypothetical protein